MSTKSKKEILSNNEYRNQLETIIQRDYFPIPAATHDTTTSTTVSSSLDAFHRSTISDQTASLQQRLQQEQQTRWEKSRFLYNNNQQRNALFFPIESSTTTLPDNNHDTLTTVKQGDSTNFSIPLIQEKRDPNRELKLLKTIEPQATRFPDPADKMNHIQTEIHWEDENNDDDDDDDDTNLDASVVHSIASEIRQGKVLQQQQRQIRPFHTVTANNQSGYPFPPPSARDVIREHVLSSSTTFVSESKSFLPSQSSSSTRNSSNAKTAESSNHPTTTIRVEPKKLSVRSKNSLRVALRSAYQKRKKEKLKQIS